VKFIKNTILNNFSIKFISLVLALFTWSYISDQLYKEGLGKESETASLIKVTGENIVVKKLPIYVKIEGEPAAGYRVILDKISISPSSSVVAGPPDIIETLTYIATEPVSVQGRNNSVKHSANIADIAGCKIGYEGLVNVTIPITRIRKR
jgi:YbbR domain-containing protein